jgi:beta-glucosidase-like glycosyl hydrolase
MFEIHFFTTEKRECTEKSCSLRFFSVLSVFSVVIFLLPFFVFASSIQDMTLEEKVGQLFVAPAAPLLGEEHWKDWEHLLVECHIGNALLKASDASSQILFLERLQAASPIPLLIAADAEWGLGMRMSDAISFPRNLTLGAVRDLSLLEEMGRWIGRHAKRVGIHLNLAPVADVNSNPLNPVIHMRSFGEDPKEVGKRVQAIIRGMKSGGLLTCAKHFPGHGDTHVDSHEALPTTTTLALPAFRAAMDAGVDFVMSGHLLCPSLDDVPTSLSFKCMTSLLRTELGFSGFAITDALNMGALSSITPEEIAVQAYAAGHDFLLYGAHLKEDVDELMKETIPRAYRGLLLAFQDERLSVEELDRRVERILELKKQYCQKGISSSFLLDPEALLLKKKLYLEALTLVGGPLSHELPSRYIAVGGHPDDWMVQRMRERGVEVLCLALNETHPPLVGGVVGLHRVKSVAEGFGLSSEMKEFLKESEEVWLFCTPYAITLFPHAQTMLIAYENVREAGEVLWEARMGSFKPHGRLPVLLPIDGEKKNTF